MEKQNNTDGYVHREAGCCFDDEHRALYLLNSMQGMFSDKLLKVREHFGSYADAYRADAGEYYAAGLFVKKGMEDAFEALKHNEARLLRRAEGFETAGIRLIADFDAAYPERLRSIPDRPPLIYVSGNLPDDRRPSAAMVGSRKCSEYGRSVAEKFAGELAEHGVQIVSGLAYGIDGAAARGSLRSAGESYGVLGCGINICYPKCNENMYDAMRHGSGGIVSEFPLDMPALGYHFVLRNRLIAGLADVLIVIEAAAKSGTATTVEYALQQGRDVYALPGRIDDPLGCGCNQLIKDGASIITESRDILDYFGINDSDRDDENAAAAGSYNTEMISEPYRNGTELSEDEAAVLKVLGIEPKHIEAIAESCGLEVWNAAAALGMLETRGLAAAARQSYYKRT